jgi:ABC-type multidrug transport system permease subunit
MAPGIMVTIIFILTIGLTALMFVIEKKEGLLDRSWSAGVITIEVMMAHVSAKIFIMTIQTTILILLVSFVFEVGFV